MYIAPNTEIRLLTGVPLDNTYAHTLYFASKEAQATYFASKTMANGILSSQSYQRYAKGTMRVARLADDIYNANYMMFKNTSFGNRWFYAFINRIEYVSNTTSEIEYEIDVMQTWFFDVTLLQSFVEREHSATDVAGENIVPEPVPLGDDYMGIPRPTQLFNDFDIIIVSPYMIDLGNTYNEVWQPFNPLSTTDIQNVPEGLCYEAINTHMSFSTPREGYTDILSYLLYKYSSQYGLDSIASVYIVPRYFLNFTVSGLTREHLTLNYGDNVYISDEEEIEYFPSKPTALSHGYVPKNKKLLTYPYNKLCIDTADGNIYDYAFEFFSTNNVRFKIKSNLNTNTSYKAVPLYYKGEDENFTEGCLLTDFPMMSLSIDGFKAWLAQNKSRLGLQIASDVLGVGNGLGSVMAGSQMLTPVTRVLSKTGAKFKAEGYDEIGKSGVRGVGQTIAELTDRARVKYHPKAGSIDGALEMAHNKKDFTAIQYSVNPQNALIIDDFFNCYGYATHRVKVPNRNVRPHWTYVKTIDINLESNAPADDTNKIASIYDSGITFWNNPAEVGNYSLNNSPS